MPVHPISTAIGWCELHHAAGLVTGFRLPGPDSPSPAPGEPPPEWVRQLATRVVAHLRGDLQDFADVPFEWSRVTAFQRTVLQAALAVKPGHTSTYGALAAAAGQPPNASRAIGTVLSQNPWPLLVPCHRFLSAHRRMTGFSAPGGIGAKLRLLVIERSELVTGA